MDKDKMEIVVKILNSRYERRLRWLEDRRAQRIIREACYNLLKGLVPMTKLQKKKLMRHADAVRKLALKKTCMRERCNLTQRTAIVRYLFRPLLNMNVERRI